MNSLYAGIDVSKNSNVTYLMKPDGTKHSVFSIPNDISGAKLLSERIVASLKSLSLSEVVIGMEATSVYGELLVYSLREDENLKQFQHNIHVLNPKQVAKFKLAYPDLPKKTTWTLT